MQFTTADRKRVERRYQRVRLRFQAAILVLGVQVVLLGVVGMAKMNAERWSWTLYLLTAGMIASACGYVLASTWRQYFGLRKDLQVGQKEVAIAPLLDKRQQRDADGQRYYLRFPLGTIECGEALYHRLAIGEMLTLTLSRYGRELLAVERAEWQHHSGPGPHRQLAGG